MPGRISNVSMPRSTRFGQSRSASWQARNAVPSERGGAARLAPNPRAKWPMNMNGIPGGGILPDVPRRSGRVLGVLLGVNGPEQLRRALFHFQGGPGSEVDDAPFPRRSLDAVEDGGDLY